MSEDEPGAAAPGDDPAGGSGPLGFGSDAVPGDGSPDRPPAPAGAEQRWRVADDPAALHGSRRSRVPIGIAVFAVIGLLAWVGFNTLQTDGVGSSGPAVGEQAPPFAGPLATSRVEGDVNVARKSAQGAAGHVAACSVRGPGIVNLCDLRARGPVVLVFFTSGQARCRAQLSVLEQLRGRHPGVAIAGIALGGDRSRARSLVHDLRLHYPVVYDRDSVLANLYGVAVCPLLTLISRDGTVRESLVGSQTARILDARLRVLERGGPG